MLEQKNLRNHFLIALDNDHGSPFHRAVVYICEHDKYGSMGLIINRLSGLHLNDIFSSMQITVNNFIDTATPIFTGGPVKENAGFVLHRHEGTWESSLQTSDKLAVTSSKDIIHAFANNNGPKESLITLGFSGWEVGQLESEIAKNVWLTCPAHEDIIFNVPIAQRWNAAVESMGFSPNQLVTKVGHA